mmetsp:Transcript_447/g.1000  ORF Transcript_447/g.1000 Transcript_447/m.1000 type:complete len:127 (+) Transcript_447:302-682(+)
MEEEDRSVKPELQAELRTFCVQACHGKSKGSFRTQTSAVMSRFPGAMAADLSETDLWHKVKAMPYVACEESDGTRYAGSLGGPWGVFDFTRMGDESVAPDLEGTRREAAGRHSPGWGTCDGHRGRP